MVNLDGNDIIRETELSTGERVEIYDFEATYTGENFDITGFYHTPRFHWGYEGDFFGLVHEATDVYGMDIWNAKAPEGIEFQGKNKWKNLRVLMGPEVYWGANPKFIVKYDFNLAKFDWTFIHSEDVARSGEGASATQATERQSRQTTLFAEREFANGWKLELGGIMSAYEKIDDVYTRVDGVATLSRPDRVRGHAGLQGQTDVSAARDRDLCVTHIMPVSLPTAGRSTRSFGVIDPSRLPYSRSWQQDTSTKLA